MRDTARSRPYPQVMTTSGLTQFGTVAGASVVAEFLRVHASDPRRTAFGRFFGSSPLSPDSRPWYLGALGEMEVGRVLDSLGPGWTTVHAVPIGKRGSDVDHIVVGPPGVFTINAKFHERARVWVGARRILVDGQKTDHIRNARFEASRVARTLAARLGKEVPTLALIVVVAARSLTIRQQPADVAVLSSSAVARWLSRQSPMLDADSLGAVTSAVRDPATWGAAPPVPDLAEFARVHRTVRAARRTRICWMLASFFPILGAVPFLAGSALMTLLSR